MKNSANGAVFRSTSEGTGLWAAPAKKSPGTGRGGGSSGVHIVAGGQGGGGAVGNGGGQLAHGFAAAVPGHVDARGAGAAGFVGIKISVRVQIGQRREGVVFRDQADGDEQAVAQQRFLGFPCRMVRPVRAPFSCNRPVMRTPVISFTLGRRNSAS